MSLATRCPACNTTFRVVQDQLKVSEGWVRCGRCNEVFNAIEGLFDLDREGTPSQPMPLPGRPEAVDSEYPAFQSTLSEPPPSVVPEPLEIAQEAPPTAPAPLPPPPGPTAPTAPVAAAAAAAAAFARNAPSPAEIAAEIDDNVAPTAYEVLDSSFLDRSTYGSVQPGDLDDGFADARFDSTHEALELESEAVAAGAPAWQPKTLGNARKKSHKPARSKKAAAARRPPEDPNAPEFLRKAEREAHWQSPRMRLGLSLFALLLGLTLVLQIALQWRDWLAVYRPALRPTLVQLCRVAGCTVGPLRRIDDVVVDSSSLARGSGPDAYRLSVLLRNRGPVALALPHIDLTLSDGNGDLVARRALAPRDFGVGDSIDAGAEVTLTLDLSTPGHRVAGFTVEAFYP
ncbi:zinc-ribbon and DUF3426 domain-containing protein [Caldimonas brevitalea]|uniref:Transmembrane protein n=1 Tax=Caldimonas brevitalea TaxID=413882 RepID=A0A0G3BEJ0_9BURK|nr:zinc-ribbon and DUF3426 domain-containing protein [Caldimonas brevitalea]AKJ27747.1 transmembrane protein [Caldimonas brevitalea]